MPESDPTQSNESPPAQHQRTGLRARLALLLGLAVAIVLFYATGLNRQLTRDNVLRHLESYRLQVAENRALAVVVFFAIYVALTALSVPVGMWLSLLAGALFGRWLGTGIVIVAATLGASLAFLATRYLFGGVVQRRFGDRLAGLNAGIEQDGAYYLLTMRLIPAIPFWLINLGMGLTRMRLSTFASVSFIGMLPGTFLYVNAGDELAQIRSPADVMSLSVIVSLALVGLLPLVLRKTRRYWGSTPNSDAKGSTRQ